MSLEFNGSSQYLSNVGSVIASPAMTVACWFWPDSSHAAVLFETSGDNGAGTDGYNQLAIESTGEASCLVSTDDGVSETGSGATSANTYTTGAWNHVIGGWSLGRRRVALNNGTTALSGISFLSAPVDDTFVASSTGGSQFFDGRIAEMAIWDQDLLSFTGAANIKQMLYNGLDPLKIANIGGGELLHLFRYVNGSLIDIVGNYSFSATGSPTAADHPRIFRHQPSRLIVPIPVTTVSLRLKGNVRFKGNLRLK